MTCIPPNFYIKTIFNLFEVFVVHAGGRNNKSPAHEGRTLVFFKTAGLRTGSHHLRIAPRQRGEAIGRGLLFWSIQTI